MADKVYFEVEGLGEMEDGFGRMAQPKIPSRGHRKLDMLFGAAAAAVRSNVHVDTGRLKESGRKSTHFLGDIWVGEIQYARYPGIFELGRGNTPSLQHPEGNHFFFNAVEPFIPAMEEAVAGMFEEFFNESPI